MSFLALFTNRRSRMGHQVFRNICSSYLSLFAGLLGVLVLVPLYTRFLGHRLYGEWLVINTIATYLVMADLGIDQTLVNRIAEALAKGTRSEVQVLVSTAFFAYSGITLVLIGAFALFAPRLSSLLIGGTDSRASLALFASATLIALALPFTAYSAVLRGFQRVDLEQLIATYTNIGRSAGLAVAVISGLGLVPLAMIHGGAAICRGLFASLRASPLLEVVQLRPVDFSFRTLRSLIGPSMAFFVLRIAGVVGFGIDNLVIGYELGPEAVTHYAVPYSLVLLPSALLGTALTALMPTITANLAESDRSHLVSGFLLAMRCAIAFAAVCVLSLSIAGPSVLWLWAGPGVFPGIATFRWQLALLFIQVLIEPPYAILVASTRHYGAAALHVFESSLNLALSLWWVRLWGLSGVIAGTVIARLLTTAWYIPITGLLTFDIRAGVGIRTLGPTLVLCLVASGGAMLLGLSEDTSKMTLRLSATLIAALIFVLAFYVIVLGHEDRRKLLEFLETQRR